MLINTHKQSKYQEFLTRRDSSTLFLRLSFQKAGESFVEEKIILGLPIYPCSASVIAVRDPFPFDYHNWKASG